MTDNHADGALQADDRLREFQLYQLDILKEFARVCDEHGLTWWLGYGTLLGAARHEGFIPWDDDIDILMPSEDYLKFRDACEQSLGDAFYFQSHGAKPCNFISWQRIGVKNSTSLPYEYADIHGEWGICIDVFPTYPTAAPDQSDFSRRAKLVAWLDKLSAKHLYRHQAAQQEGFVRKLYYRAMGAMPDAINKSLWNRALRKLLIPFGANEYGYVGALGTEKVFPARLFDETVELPFEGMMLPAPAGYEEYLSLCYGDDWREIPPMENRVFHSGGGSDEVLVSFDEPFAQYLK